MRFLLLLLITAVFSQEACQAESYGGCIFSGSSWESSGDWPCAEKSCPFHLKSLPGDCKQGMLPWPSKGNESASPYNDIGVTTIVTLALLNNSRFDLGITPQSPDVTGFVIAGKPNQYFALSGTGSLISATDSGAIIEYDLPNVVSFVASAKYVVTAFANENTGLTEYVAIPNDESPSGSPMNATLPGTKLETWPMFADGDYVYAMTINDTRPFNFNVLRWDPSGAEGFEQYSIVTGDSECVTNPAGMFWSMEVQGDMLGLLLPVNSVGGYPCVFNMKTPKSARYMFKNNDDATSTFQMSETGNVVYQNSKHIWYVTYPDLIFRDLNYEIQFATIYQLYNGSTVHFPSGGVYFWKDEWLHYQGNGGFWAYHFLQSGSQPFDVLPVVLDFNIPNYADCGQTDSTYGKSFQFNELQIAANGTLYVRALTSVDGAHGATGPIFGINSAITVPNSACSSCLDQGNGGNGTCANAVCHCNSGCSGSDCSFCVGPQ